ncbi:piggyBac transposable element-derived protein 3-like [Dermacentor albipictus]|uniref:piggyBac transposable element-derived protein 3-like n=1 Tax=Dermacentor albipictus TaxID=60249 RepID=UPI0031FCB928
MDAAAFYGNADLRNHGRQRRRLDDDSAESLLSRIGDGNTSDIGLSDDEEEEGHPNQSAAVTDNEACPSGAAERLDPLLDHDEQQKYAGRQKRKAVWTSAEFEPPDTTFHSAGRDVSAVIEPCEYFFRYFTEELFEEIARCTNIYALQTSGAILGTTPEEIKTFFGMLLIMGTLKFPRIRMYWSPATQIPSVSGAMSVNRFFRLRSALHVTEPDPDHTGTDKFWKVRPLLDAVRKRCLELPPTEKNSIDEQMIPFTGRVVAKQFVRNKPNPEGVKVFVRCSSSGVAHDFEFYQGKGTGTSVEHKHLGLGGSIVMRLTQHLPKLRNFKCYFDNYFTSITLLQELKEIGIWAIGTIRSNRLQGCPLKSEKALKKEGRGSMDASVTKSGDVTVVRWQDNGIVNIASTFVGVGEPTNVKRWSEASKKHVDIPCPEIISQYNESMGGVDKMDFLLSLYPLKQRTRKWPVRVISHFTSFSLVNGWQEYLADANDNCFQRRKMLDLLAFQNDVGLALIMCNKNGARKRGRPSNDAKEPPRKVHNAEPRPVNAVRYDGMNHWPAHTGNSFAQRCKLEGCNSRTRVRCRKCNVFLCLSATNDCFYAFHNK